MREEGATLKVWTHREEPVRLVVVQEPGEKPVVWNPETKRTSEFDSRMWLLIATADESFAHEVRRDYMLWKTNPDWIWCHQKCENAEGDLLTWVRRQDPECPQCPQCGWDKCKRCGSCGCNHPIWGRKYRNGAPRGGIWSDDEPF